MRICKNCGTKNRVVSKYCSVCGSELKKQRSNFISNILQAIVKPIKRNKKKSIIVISAIVIVFMLIGAINSFTGSKRTQESTQNNSPTLQQSGNDKSSSQEEGFLELDLNEFQFSDDGVESYEEMLVNPVVTDFSPTSGVTGTMIDIIGEGLSQSHLTQVKMGETVLHPFNMTDSKIQVLVPEGAFSGDIALEYEDNKLEVGSFTVNETDKTLLLNEVVTNIDKTTTFKAENIAVTIPANTLDEQKTITIEKINNPNVNDLAAMYEGTAYSINVEDQHLFNNTLEIEIPVPADYKGSPYVVYFDTETSIWRPMYCELTDNNTFIIYTDHLTDLWFTLWYKSVKSPNGNFQVYYDEGDKLEYSGSSNVKELAESIAKYLEDAQEDYNNVLSDDFKLKNSTGYIRVSEKTYKEPFNVLVHSEYNKDGGLYSPLSSVIYLPTKYKDLSDVKTTAAHELFHLFQNKKINMFTMDKNKWIIEAVAELASHRVAFPEDSRKVKIWQGTQPTSLMTTLDEIHEYSMASFIDYMLDESHQSLVNMWEYLVNNSVLADLNKPLEDYFLKAKELSILSLNYKNFWRSTVGDNQPLRTNDPDILAKRYLLDKNKHALSYKHVSGGHGTQKFISIIPRKFSENVPERIFKVKATSIDDGEIQGVMLDNMSDYEIKAGMQPDGHNWETVADSKDTEGYKLYQCQSNEKDAILLSLYASKKGEAITVSAREIIAQCAPQKLEKAVPGKEYTFKFAFKDIFVDAENMLLEVDYGDGKVSKKSYSQKSFIGVKAKHIYQDIKNYTIKATIYDVTGGKKEKISQLVLPVIMDNKIVLTPSSTVAQQDEQIDFSLNVSNKNYKYEWDFDGKTTKQGQAKESFSYKEIGNYNPKVKVFDDAGKLLGEASCAVEIKVATIDNNQPVSSEPAILVSSSHIVEGDTVGFSTNIQNKKYKYQWWLSGELTEGIGLWDVSAEMASWADVTLVIYDEKGEQLHSLYKELQVEKGQYDWVLYDTKVTNANNVVNYKDSYDATITNGSATGKSRINNGQYTVHSEASWDPFKDKYPAGEDFKIPIQNIVTNIDELYGNEKLKGVFYRTLVVNFDIECITKRRDGSEDKTYGARILTDDAILMGYQETYTYGEKHVPENAYFSLYIPGIHYTDKPSKQEKTLIINVGYGIYEEGAKLQLFYKPVRVN